MAQHDMNIANQGFPATRADLNNALQALVSNSSGTSAPSTTFANQWWYDTTNNKMYIRNEANNAWIEVAVLDQTNNEWQITTGVVQAKDSDGLALKTDDGTTRLFVLDGGDVGIATISVSSIGVNHKTVQINGANTSGTGALRLQSTDGSLDSGLWQTTNGVFFGAISNHPIIFRTNNTERMRLLAGGGLTFNGDTAAANALDDYEEGTWAATAVSGLSSISSSTANNRYTKIGNVVSVIGEMFTFSGQTSDALEIGGLPYAVGSGYESSCSIMYQNIDLDSGYTQLVGYAKAGSTVLRLYEEGDNVAYSLLRGNQTGAGTSFIFQMTYHT